MQGEATQVVLLLHVLMMCSASTVTVRAAECSRSERVCRILTISLIHHPWLHSGHRTTSARRLCHLHWKPSLVGN